MNTPSISVAMARERNDNRSQFRLKKPIAQCARNPKSHGEKTWGLRGEGAFRLFPYPCSGDLAVPRSPGMGHPRISASFIAIRKQTEHIESIERPSATGVTDLAKAGETWRNDDLQIANRSRMIISPLMSWRPYY